MASTSTPWSRRAFLGAAAGAGALASTGGSSLAGATAPGRRAPARGLPPRSTWRKPDSRPYPDRPAGTDSVTGIDHIVVVMQENHSFDNYFGMLRRGDGFTFDRQGRPINANPYQDKFLTVYHETNTCQPGGVDQTWNNSHLQFDHGTNQGFANANAGVAAMGYFDQGDIPFYYSLARAFPLCDRYFCSVLGQTYPNRRFLMCGTAMGTVNSDISQISLYPPNGTIFDRLHAYDISWKNYKTNISTLAIILKTVEKYSANVVDVSQFHADAASGNLPAVSFVDSNVLTGDEENPQDLQLGEAFVAGIIGSLLHSPAWERTMLIWTYDEHGGWYDHVPPPPAIAPDDIAPMITVPPDQPGAYDRYGFRVPTIVVSGRARRDLVSHTVYDHTSVLKTIERKWNLPALTYRDANANDLFDCIDLTGPAPFAEPPTLAKPANTTGVSVCAQHVASGSKAASVIDPDPPASAYVARRPTVSGRA